MTDRDVATTHALERTSPKGGPFVGRCILCGAEGLTSKAVLELCPNPRGMTCTETVLETIEGPTDD